MTQPRLGPEAHILYVGAILPKRSETFVYREVLGLRARGIEVSAASVHPPERDLGDPALDALAADAVSVYGRGGRAKLALARDAARAAWWRPVRGLLENPTMYWPKYVLQSEAGYALAWRVRDRGITHVHAHMAHVPATVAMSCAEALEVPFSLTGHAADLFRDRSALKTKLQRASFVACISQWHRRFYQQQVPGLPDSRLPVIRCGVNLEEFAPVDPAAADGRRLLAVGRLVPKKGFDVLLRAMARPAAASTRLTLVGDGPEEPALRELATQLKLGDRVDFVGAKPNHAVRELMGEAGVFVLPCREAADGDRDGIPVVLMEAMARRVCVISGDLETIRELVSDKVSGLMVRPGSVDELAEALGTLTGDAAMRGRLAEAGRARVAQEFALGVTLDRLEQAFATARIPPAPKSPPHGDPAPADPPQPPTDNDDRPAPGPDHA